MEGSVGLRTLNERINRLEPLAVQAHREPISDVPTVVQLDGIWLTIQGQTEKEKPDRAFVVAKSVKASGSWY